MIKNVKLDLKHGRLLLAAGVCLACFLGARAEQEALRARGEGASSVNAGLAGEVGPAALALFGSGDFEAASDGASAAADRKPTGKSKAARANNSKRKRAPNQPGANRDPGGAASPAPAPPQDPGGSEEGSAPLPSLLGVSYGPLYWGDEFLSFTRELGVKRTAIKLHWMQIEPADDEFNFALIDAFVDQLEPNEEGLVTLLTSSTWGTGGIGKGSPPLDLEVYKSFVFEVVSHCRGKVKYWARDPEPFSPGHWPPELWLDYLYTQEAFYQAVKAADPDALVVGVGHSGIWINGQPGGVAFYTILLQYGHSYFDIVDIHLYRDPYTIPERVGWFRDKMQEFGYSKPIVACEYGGPHPSQFPEGAAELTRILTEWNNNGGSEEEDEDAWRIYLHSIRDTVEEPSLRMFLADPPAELAAKRNRIHARDIVQRTLFAVASGVRMSWYWNLSEPWPEKMGPHPYFGKQRLVDPANDQPEAAFSVYRLMAQKLAGLSTAVPLDSGAPDVYLFHGDRGTRGPVYVIWEKRPPFEGEEMDPVAYGWASPWLKVAVTDVFGNESELYCDGGGIVTLEITDTPLYLEEAGSGD